MPDYYTPKDIKRFWSSVDTSQECWEWTGPRTGGGYGHLYIGYFGRNIRAHRMSFELHFEVIPDGLDVCHTCDNPPCVRPDHLFTGTTQQNVVDMIDKGRHEWIGKKGELHHSAKLTPEAVQYIRDNYVPRKVPCRVFAAMFGVGSGAIWKVVSGKRWHHVH